MENKLYVGNLTYGFRDEDLSRLFSAHGYVQSAKVMMDRDAGRSKGFGFVEMGSASEAQAAISALNGQYVENRALAVNIARPREERPSSFGGNSGGNSYRSNSFGGNRGGYGGGRSSY